MAAPRQPRRGPAPFASFDHDNSDESSPETKQPLPLPEIREDSGAVSLTEGGSEEDGGLAGGGLAPPGRPRSQSTPGGAAPRIDISRASSSSHHDSRDSSPDMALFSGDDTRARLDVAFREDGALDLRSSTEELAFLEEAPGAPPAPPAAPPPPAAPRRHSRKDSQGSEAALLGVSGRTSRLSSVGSACSAVSAVSGLGRVSRLSVVSGMSRSPSPHKMLLETSFCGPRPIETDPDACAAAVEERLLEMARRSSTDRAPDTNASRQIHAEVTVEPVPRPASVPTPAPAHVPAPAAAPIPTPAPDPPPPVDEDKRIKETRNKARAEERRGRPRVRREPSEPEVYKTANRNKNVIRIKLKPDEESEEPEEEPELSKVTSVSAAESARKPASLELERTSPCPLRRSPSPAAPVSRKSSFCSLFKSKETIASPDSPSGALRRKKSLTEGRSRSKSRDRSATPTSSSKLRGSVLSLFRTPRRSVTSPAPSSRAGSPPGPASRPATAAPLTAAERLKYYTEARDGIIHIPLRTPPEERASSRPASAPVPDRAPHPSTSGSSQPPARRTVLPDGSIIIPLRSPTERAPQSPEPREQITRTVVASIEAPPPTAISPPTVEDKNNSSECESNQSRPSCEPTPVQETITPPQDISERVTEPIDKETERRKKRERLVFSTHVGSKEQVFSTQFSITKTPSITSEISASYPSLPDGGEEFRPPPLRDTRITSDDTVIGVEDVPEETREEAELGRDSSESDGSCSARGNEVEARGLVVQESFEEELPYVPTTLPQERPLALPMVPVRERAAAVSVAGVRRPRGSMRAPPPGAPPATPPAAGPPITVPPPTADKLRIKLPRRPRATSASAPAQPQRTRTASGTESTKSELPSKCEWIDFEEVPERRKQPKRIQTLPVADQDDRQTVVFNYVEPDQCRCECHTHSRDDELPLLQGTQPARDSLSSLEGGEELGAHAHPFTADLDLQHEPHIDTDRSHGTLRRQ